jgi:hypothetical protein
MNALTPHETGRRLVIVAADLQRVVARNQAALLRQQLVGSARSATAANVRRP